MHFGIASNTGLIVAFLAIHDSILGEALLAEFASRGAAALKVAASLSCLEGERKIPSQFSR